MPSTAVNPVVNPASIDEAHIHVVAAVLWHPQLPRKFLIAQRQKGKHLEHYWEFPGGKLEPDEAPWQGLVREIEEEIGVVVVRGAPLIRVYYRYPERNVLLDTWRIDEYRGEIEAREQQALAWIGIDEIESYDFPPADLPILDLIRCSATA